MAVITENEIDLSVVNLKPIQDEINNINTHLVIGENSIDLVGDDGTLYASYGVSAVFYGANSQVEVYSNGLAIRDSEDNVYFDVHKTNEDDEVSERLSVTIADYDKEKIASLGLNFTDISKVELIGRTSTIANNVISESEGGNSGTFTDSDGAIMASWSVSGNVVTVSTYGIASKYKSAFARGSYRIYGIRFYGTCPSQTSMTFNGVEYDYPLEQGVANGWHYKKMASGELECWQIVQGDFKIATSQASEYVSPNIILEDYPVPFMPFPCVSVHCQSPSSEHGFARVVNYPVTSPRTNIGVIRLNRQNSMSTATEFIISLSVKGRWK